MTSLLKLQITKDLVRSGVLHAPASFMNSPMHVLAEVCNGCGAANAKFDFVPDRIYGTDISAACQIHDFMYDVGTTIEDKEEADRVFLNNILRLIERDKHKWYKPTWLQRRRAQKYYWAVSQYGGPAFWAGKN